ncbi:MAG: hypothetical protein AAF959_20250 [Cyanobacteria bacterium P01_D01_bin.56]
MTLVLTVTSKVLAVVVQVAAVATKIAAGNSEGEVLVWEAQ